MFDKNQTPPLGAAGLDETSLLGGLDIPPNAPMPDVSQAKSELIRAQLAARWPAQYADGLAVGLGEKPESPREPGDYPKGFHTWLPECRNAWWAGANMGAILFSRLQDGGSDE